MIDVIKQIGTYLNEFHECKNEELPLNFDYKKNIGVYFEITSSSDNEYKTIYPLEVHFISDKNNKLKLLELLDIYKNNLVNKIITNYRLVAKEPLILDAQDDVYEHFILNLYINSY